MVGGEVVKGEPAVVDSNSGIRRDDQALGGSGRGRGRVKYSFQGTGASAFLEFQIVSLMQFTNISC